MEHGECLIILHMRIMTLGMDMVGILGIIHTGDMEVIMEEVVTGQATTMDIMMVFTIDIIMETVILRIIEERDMVVVILQEQQFLEIQVLQETHQEQLVMQDPLHLQEQLL